MFTFNLEVFFGVFFSGLELRCIIVS